MQVAEYWLRQGIDGWRLDVPFEIKTAGFWQEFRQRVKAINPDAYIVGEIWHDSREWLQGDQFDAVMNYLFAEVGDRVCGRRARAARSGGRAHRTSPSRRSPAWATPIKIDWLLKLYPWEIQLAQLNLLDSHDTARLISIAGGDRDSVRLATLLLMTFPGAPSIYYGDEIGLPGTNFDPDTRRTIAWDRPNTWDMQALDYHKQLIAMRHAHPALRTGAYHRLHADDDSYVFARTNDDEALLVAINVAAAPRNILVPSNGLFAEGSELEPVYGGSGARIEDGQIWLNLAGHDGLVLRAAQ